MAPTVSDHLWSGPGRALQAHLRHFEELQAENRLLTDDTARRSVIGLQLKHMLHWVDFAKTYSRSPAVVDRETRKVIAGGERLTKAEVYEGRTRAEFTEYDYPTWDDQTVIDLSMRMFQTEHDLLNTATTYYVASHMMDLVTEAAGLAEPEPLFPTDVPTPSGFVVFEKPLILPDLHPLTGELVDHLMPIRAMAWTVDDIYRRDFSEMTKGVIILTYTDKAIYRDIYLRRLAELKAENDNSVLDQMAMELLPVEYHPWAYSTDWTTTNDIDQARNGVVVGSVGFVRRWFLAFMRLMWQRLAQPEHWQPDRAQRRRIERVFGRQAPSMSVLHLRRFVEQKHYREADSDNWANWPYLYRIPVRAHWRRQHFPSLGAARNDDGSWNQDSHRLVFIARHYRGPEHLPIQERDDVTAVVR